MAGTRAAFDETVETVEEIDGVRYRVKRKRDGTVVFQAGADPVRAIPTRREDSKTELRRLLAIDPATATTADVFSALLVLLNRS